MNEHVPRSEDLELRFTGRFADANQVPASMLVEVLTGLQRAIHLLAMQIEGTEARQKERITRAIESKYVVLCYPSAPGSYCVGVRIGDPSYDLLAGQSIREVSSLFSQCIEIISQKSNGRLAQAVPDKMRRMRFLDAVSKMVPRKGSGVHLRICRPGGTEFSDSIRLQSGLREFMPGAGDEEAICTVTGRLSKIDFDERKITVVYPVTDRELDCFYDESVEDMLLENPRELIQVTGKVILDDNDEPKKIVDVEDIREVDLSPFYLEQLEYDERILRFREPIMLEPELDETKQLFCVRRSDFGIDAHAFTRDELDEGIRDVIDVLWRSYALEVNERLTPQAQELKQKLLAALEEIPHAKR